MEIEGKKTPKKVEQTSRVDWKRKGYLRSATHAEPIGTRGTVDPCYVAIITADNGLHVLSSSTFSRAYVSLHSMASPSTTSNVSTQPIADVVTVTKHPHVDQSYRLLLVLWAAGE